MQRISFWNFSQVHIYNLQIFKFLRITMNRIWAWQLDIIIKLSYQIPPLSHFSKTILLMLLNVQSQPYFEKRMMYNISVTWESIQFIDTEHIFSKSHPDPTQLLVSIIGYFLILATNISLIKFYLLNLLSKHRITDNIWCTVYNSKINWN